MTLITRRNLIVAGAAGLVAGCDTVGRSPAGKAILTKDSTLHHGLQRFVGGKASLAREFRSDQMSPIFRVNGTSNPNTPDYNALAADGFANWRLRVDGLVERPITVSLAQLRAAPQREQITRHDCVEGWSAIGKWRGPQLSRLLDVARVKDRARYIVFHCADLMGDGAGYYESLDLVDAFHPQTILAWAMNGAPLSVGHGAPARLRVERQLGYKHAKYLMRIEAVESLAGIGGGGGGYWEDRAGYEWYAGI